MESAKFDREKGQILVQVAIMVGVLLAFVALAVDGGQVYGGRRRMQNAADAGALAGARELCFGEGTEDAARAAALSYATERNGADSASVVFDMGGGITVTVVASQTLDTFFAPIMDINTVDVRAEAAAICGPLGSGGGTFPLAFSWDVYSNTIGCDEHFLIFDDVVDCAETDDDCTPEGCKDDDCCKEFDCGLIPDPYMGTGNYGWLDLPDPGEEYLPDYYKPGTCTGVGEGWLECWVRYSYPPLLEPGQCILTEHGKMDAVGDDVNARADKLGLINSPGFDDADIADPYVNIILWEEWCDANQDQIRIAGFGCVKLIQYLKDYEITECSGKQVAHKIVEAQRICPTSDDFDQCRSYTGSGMVGGESESFGVSLVK